jgi:molecular chaperone HscA
MPIQIDLGSSTSTSQKKPTSSGKPVGIDLGTTHSLIGAVLGSTKSVHIFEESPNQRLVKSLVTLSLKDGKIHQVGNAALKNLTSEELLISSVKRLMGRSFKDFESKLHEIPYPLVSDPLGAQVLIGGTPARRFSPIEISSAILKHLKKIAETKLGETIGPAVITVPAYFDDAQRAATIAAGRLAGLEVLRVFNEPTAAALAYGWSFEKPGKVVVFDLGGGTFDISILRIEENIYEVLSTRGDTQLGGDDYDAKIVEYILSQKPELEKLSRHALLKESERLKKALTETSETLWTLGTENAPILLTREKAETLWKDLNSRFLECCEAALKDAGLKLEDLDDVLLVGGSTRMPTVRSAVETFFKRKPNTSLDPDQAVAMGATLQAEALAGNSNSQKLLLDVIPLSLGLETYGGAVSKLLVRNQTLPTEAREVFTNHAENQTAFDFHIVQGERELVKDCRSLARFKLKGLTPAPPGYHRIEVIFRVDSNGILNVKARDLRSKRSHEIEVRPSFGITDEQLFELLESAENNALVDMAQRQLVDIKIEADTVIRATEKTLTNVGHKLEPSERSEIQARLIDLKNSVSSAQADAIRKALSDLDGVARELAELQVNEAISQALSGKGVDSLSKK